MAKSKEVKRAEALERKRDFYVSHHLLEFINYSPVGVWWWDGELKDMELFVRELASLRELAKEADLTLTGSRVAYDSRGAWSTQLLFNHLIVAGTIHKFCSDCNANRVAMGLKPAAVDPIDVWGPRLQKVLALADHPQIKHLLKTL
jgi:hypothetical protein